MDTNKILKQITTLLSSYKKTKPTRNVRPNHKRGRKFTPRRYRPNRNYKRVPRTNFRPRNNQRGKLLSDYMRDEKVVKRDNQLNTGSFFTGKHGTNNRSRNKFNQRRPNVNHQNQTSSYAPRYFYNRKYTRGKRQAEISPYNDTPANASSPSMDQETAELLSKTYGSGVHFPMSVHHAIKNENDVLADPLKRTLIYEKAVIDLTRNLATGWYAGIRKACIKFGPLSMNDKYFVEQAYRTMSDGGAALTGDPTSVRYNAFIKNHTLMINFLQNLLIANYNYMIGNDITKLLTRLPQHIAFALTVAAKKFVMRVRNGATNIATRIPNVLLQLEAITGHRDPCFWDDQYSSLILAYVPPTSFIAGGTVSDGLSSLLSEVTGLVNYLYSVQQHERYPYNTVDEIQTKLPGLTHYDSAGAAIKIELDINEIVSVYGYAAVTGGSSFEGAYIHDLSGLEQTKISAIFRTMFFPQLTFTSISDYAQIPDEFNDKLNVNLYFDNYYLAVYYGLTATIPVTDYMLVARMPFGTADGDITKDQSGFMSTCTNSKGLTYLTTKYDSNNTRPAPYRANTRALPTFPSVTFGPEPYNLAIALAQKMNNRYFDLNAQPYPITVTQLFTLTPATDPIVQMNNSPLLRTQRSYFNMIVEALYTTAIWTLQYDARFVLPSPIIEDLKPYNSYNTWTYKGGNQSIGVQLIQQNMAPFRGLLGTPNKQEVDPGKIYDNGYIWNIKVGAVYSENGLNFTKQIGIYEDIYQKYGGVAYSAQNFDTLLETHSAALNEIRPYVKLNNCPEYETSLPSMHTLYAASNQSTGPGTDPRTRSVAIYTPMSADNYTQKNVAIFLKVALLPYFRIPDNVNVPLLNATNISEKLFGDINYQERALFNLYQYSFVANYTGQSSELDYYYEQLRRHMIGSWSDLLPIFQTAVGGLTGSATANPMSLVMSMLAPKQQQSTKKGKSNGLPNFGANGDIMNMINTILASVGNFDESGSSTVNTPKKKKEEGGSFWSTLGDIALKAAPMLLEML